MTKDRGVLPLPEFAETAEMDVGKGKADIVAAGSHVSEMIGYPLPFR